jgi:hypothetical protein
MKKLLLLVGLLSLSARPLLAQAPPGGIWQGYDGECSHVALCAVTAPARADTTPPHRRLSRLSLS